MKEVELYIGQLALNAVRVFCGKNGASAKLFIRDLEEAFELLKITVDKHMKYYFEKKLQGLPLEWYQSLKDDYSCKTWISLKEDFIQEFEKTELRLQYVNKSLMDIHQNVEEKESIQSFSYRIIKLFNDYKQLTGEEMMNEEKVSYFMDGLFPYYKLQLNNLYQQRVGVYINCLFEDVLETALKLERNHKIFEKECQQLQELGLTDAAGFCSINIVSVDIKAEELHKSQENSIEEERESIDEESVSFSDQLSSISNSLQEVHNDMLTKAEAGGSLHYEREGEQVEFDNVINDFETNYNINAEESTSIQEEIASFNDQLISIPGCLQASKDEKLNMRECINDLTNQRDQQSRRIYSNDCSECLTEKSSNSELNNGERTIAVKLISSECIEQTDSEQNGEIDSDTILEGEQVKLQNELDYFEANYNRNCEGEERVVKDFKVNDNSINEYKCSSIEGVVNDRKVKLKSMKLKGNPSEIYVYYYSYDFQKEKKGLHLNKEDERMIMSEKEPKPPWIELMLNEQQVKRVVT